MKDLLRVHLGIMIPCVLISWTALCPPLKPFPVKALAVSCEEQLLETQNFDCLLLPGSRVKAPLSDDAKIFTLLQSTCGAAGWGNFIQVNRSCGCSVVLAKVRFHEPALPPQRKLEWGTFFKTCREFADWITVTLRRTPNVCTPFLGYGMGIQKVGSEWFNAETLCVFELATFSSGVLMRLGKRLQLIDRLIVCLRTVLSGFCCAMARLAETTLLWCLFYLVDLATLPGITMTSWGACEKENIANLSFLTVLVCLLWQRRFLAASCFGA